jgi:hypothetical protein
VPELIRVLNKKEISGIDFEDKVHVVKALGQIGDCRALDTLNKMLLSKTFILKGSLEKLKDEIYISLKNYDHKTAEELIDKHKRREKNLKGDNMTIRKER